MSLNQLYASITKQCATPVCGPAAKQNRCSAITYPWGTTTQSILQAWQQGDFFHIPNYPVWQTSPPGPEGGLPVYPDQVDVLFVAMEARVKGPRFSTWQKVTAEIQNGFVNFYGINGHDRPLELMLYAAATVFGKGNYYITDLAKCAFQPGDKRRPNNKRLENTSASRYQKCFPNLLDEIECLNPKVIIAVGGDPYRYLNRHLQAVLPLEQVKHYQGAHWSTATRNPAHASLSGPFPTNFNQWLADKHHHIAVSSGQTGWQKTFSNSAVKLHQINQHATTRMPYYTGVFRKIQTQHTITKQDRGPF